MKLPRIAARILTGVACLVIVSVVHSASEPNSSGVDEPKVRPQGGAFGSIAELETHYANQSAELDRKKLADLCALAQRLTGMDSEMAFRAAFDLAVMRGFYAEAEPTAGLYAAREGGEHESYVLAESIVLIMEAERGELDKSLADLKAFLKHRGAADVSDEQRLGAPLVCALGEAYLQRLVRAGRFDIARQVCSLAAGSGHPDPAVKNYFDSRLARFELIGKPAPDFAGIDVDGKPVRLADHKGKVVLIDFWATWAPPCVAAFPHLRELYHTYRDQGFTVIGANLDSLGQDLAGKKPDPKEVVATVRWFLLHHRAAWPNIVGETAEAAAKAYSVGDVPASFLVGRDGVVTQVELIGLPLSRAIEASLKAAKP